ncbi:MAG: HAD family phosphatase [Acidobacteria bacterium]|nr:HAD family phosphatase [Acidobacteriota bacterium]
MIRGVLFDLDGVIVDTLHYHYLAWQHMFEKYEGSVSKQTILLHEGRKSCEILPILMQQSGVLIPEDRQDQFIEEKRAFYRKIVKISHFPKSFEVVDTLKRRGFKVALVTASAIQNMEHALDRKQRSHFDFILTGDEVERAKPDPESYITAARRLGLTPEECIVIENAPLGIEAAKSAGMQCIAIESTLERDHLRSADCIYKTIGELLDNPIFKRPSS